MSGPPPLPEEERSAKAKTPTKTVLDTVLVPARPTGTPIPRPPDGLTVDAVADWDVLWDSNLAGLIAETDLPALRRLFALRARHEYLMALAFAGGDTPQPGADEDTPVAELPPGMAYGSQGQMVAHPALTAALAVGKSIESLEDRFAGSLKARQNMGIRIGKLADAAKRHPELTHQEVTPRADPRIPDPEPAAPERRGQGVDVDGKPPRTR